MVVRSSGTYRISSPDERPTNVFSPCRDPACVSPSGWTRGPRLCGPMSDRERLRRLNTEPPLRETWDLIACVVPSSPNTKPQPSQGSF
jgi:hypothetical protein